MWSPKCKEILFRTPWTGSFPPQNWKVVVTFSPVNMKLGFISPAFPSPQRPMSLQTRERGLYLGFVSSTGHQVLGKRTWQPLPMAVLFLLLLFLCGAPWSAAGKEEEVGDSLVIRKVVRNYCCFSSEAWGRHLTQGDRFTPTDSPLPLILGKTQRQWGSRLCIVSFFF